MICILFTAFYLTASALSWDGNSTGGGGGGSPAGPNGYAIRTTGDNCIGYRFSLVDKNGSNKVAKVIDVFRNTEYGRSEYTAAYKFQPKYNKKQLIYFQNGSFSTSKTINNCYLESNCGFATALPAPAGMETWQNYAPNLNVILSLLNAGDISMLKNGDKIIVEPVYDIRLEGVYHALTVTETAIYGKYILGASSNGGTSTTSNSWGFIAPYVNKHYPNALYTPDGQGLWTGVSASSRQITFYDIINSGYGVGIAYTETREDFSPALGVIKCEAWEGNKSTRLLYFGVSNGPAFANWTLGSAYPRMGERIWFAVQFAPESENCYVKQTVWIDGGGIVSRTVLSNDNTWYDVMLDPVTVSTDATCYTVKARIDWVDREDNVLKYGAVKTFYIPVRPKINRFMVKAYSITDELFAQTKATGTTGCVYVGQRIRTSYTYTSDNTWTSYNDLWAAMRKWNGREWVAVAGKADGQSMNTGLNSSVSKEVDSSIGYTTVTDNSGSGEWNHIPFALTTRWVTDKANTSETDWLDINIIKADVELRDIKLVNDEGYYVDPDNLYSGDHVTVQYEYRNNTGCAVYVNGFRNDKSQISGIFKIPANGKITVSGYDFTVPAQKNFSIWGGVYLENAGIYNTKYETDGTNNAKTLSCTVSGRLDLVPIEPNAAYREKTEVITSYWLVNSGFEDCTPDKPVRVLFRAFRPDGSKMFTMYKDVIVPKGDKNLVYFRWSVPEGYGGVNVKVRACILDKGIERKTVTSKYPTVPYYVYTSPDTRYEKKTPLNFHYDDPPGTENVFASWWIYEYDNIKGFYKSSFEMKLSRFGDIKTTPATGFSAYKKNGSWAMRSGYGISVSAIPQFSYTNKIVYSSDPSTTITGSESVGYSEFTDCQYMLACFPEYFYKYGDDICKTLIKSGNKWIFDENADYGRVHFIPLYFPNGIYYVLVYQSDCWTPAGMLGNTSLSNYLIIEGAAYDDWYVKSK